MPETDPDFIDVTANDLRNALEAEGMSLESLTDDPQKLKIIGEMVEAGVCAIEQFAFRHIDQGMSK